MNNQPIPLTVHNTFLLDPRNEPILQGQPGRLYGFNIRGYLFITAVLGIFSLIVLPVLLLGTWADAQNRAALAARGVDTQATVLDHFTVENTDKRGNKSISRYGFTLQFNAGGTLYTVNKDVTAETYQQVAKGATITLHYLPDNPKLTQIAGETNYDIRPLLGISIVVAIGAGITAFLAIRDWPRKQRLQREGRLLSGRITQVNRRRTRGSGVVIEIRYTFSTPDGVTKEGKNSAFRYPEPKEPLPPVNQQVAVCYANDHVYTAL